MSSYLDVPFQLDGRGRTAGTSEDDHIYDLIRQVLFTIPGERVNRPDFGCGIGQMVFMPNDPVIAAATQFLVQGALTRWLDGVIAVQRVEVTAVDSSLEVLVVYAKRSSGEYRQDLFTSPGAAARGG